MKFFGSFFGDSGLDDVDARIDNVISSLPGIGSNVQPDNISGDFIDAFINRPAEIDSLMTFKNIFV